MNVNEIKLKNERDRVRKDKKRKTYDKVFMSSSYFIIFILKKIKYSQKVNI